MTTHYMEEADHCATDVAIIDQREACSACDAPQALKAQARPAAR